MSVSGDRSNLPVGPGASRARHAMRSLSHPVAILALGIWLLNDHLLKDAYGNGLTGKLSDGAAMVAFPLLIAVMVAGFAKRPQFVGMAATAAFFSAINISADADKAVETLLRSMGLPSGLTMDPTDLAVLPLLAVAHWVWKRAAQAQESVPAPVVSTTSRRRVGPRRLLEMGLFSLGLLATMATSAPEPPTTESTGSAVLTEAEPTLAIKVEVGLDGEKTPIVDRLDVSWHGTFFGAEPGQDLSEAIDVEVVPAADGRGVVHLSLSNPGLGPAPIEWTIIAAGDVDGPSPELAVKPEAAVDGELPEPLALATMAGSQLDKTVSVTEWQITTTGQNDGIGVAVPIGSYFGPSVYEGAQIATETALIEAQAGHVTAVQPPEGCGVDGCSFSVWLLVDSGDFALRSVSSLYAPEGVTAVTISHQLEATIATATSDVVTLGPGNTEVRYGLDIGVPSPSNPIQELTQFANVTVEMGGPDDSWVGGMEVELDQPFSPHGKNRRSSECCPTSATLRWRPNADDAESGRVVDRTVHVEVEYLSIAPIDPSELSVVMTQQ